jgi:hypothetical protein
MNSGKVLVAALAIAAVVGGPYSNEFPRLKTHSKICRATCPKCGAELKNLYPHDREWMCLKCLKKEMENESGL